MMSSHVAVETSNTKLRNEKERKLFHMHIFFFQGWDSQKKLELYFKVA